ncbi:MAG TPA: serine hydrolase [Bacteroidota bacterium]
MTTLIAGLIISMLFEGDPVKEQILERLSHGDGTYAVAFHDIDSGREILINEREMFHAASTMKTPVMIELFRKARQGKLNLDDSIVVKNEFLSLVDGSPYSMDLGEDSDDSVYSLVGTNVTLRFLIYQMITVSSNLATNILIQMADPKAVTQTMRSLGADSIQVLRGVEDQKAFEAGLNNSTTAHDLLMIFKALAEGPSVNEADREAMIGILSEQKFRDVIPAGLPSGTRVAHKTGSITGVRHDSGIVFLPDGRRYVVVFLSKNLRNEQEGKKALADVSRIIYESVAGK